VEATVGSEAQQVEHDDGTIGILRHRPREIGSLRATAMDSSFSPGAAPVPVRARRAGQRPRARRPLCVPPGWSVFWDVPCAVCRDCRVLSCPRRARERS
jgi:hypothetical protein